VPKARKHENYDVPPGWQLTSSTNIKKYQMTYLEGENEKKREI